MEEVLVDVDEPYTGVVVEKLSRRKGDMRDMRPSGGGKVRLTFNIPEPRPDRLPRRIPDRHARHRHHEPAVCRLWPVEGHRSRAGATGSLISTEDGEAVHYALFYIQERGTLFVSPGEKVYQGMILGEHSRGIGPGSEPDQGKEADQHPRRRQG